MKKHKPSKIFAASDPSEQTSGDSNFSKKPMYEYPRELSRSRRSRVSVAFAILLVVVTVLCCLYAGASGASSHGGLIINEVVSSNSGSLTDSQGGSPDWIELYNGTDSDINLSGYSIVRRLTDERASLGNVTIPAGGYTIIYADNEAYGDPPCTCFTLSKSGETLYLLDPSGIVLQQLTVPALYTDISYAFSTSGRYGYCLNPTPAATNDTSVETLQSLEEQTQSANIIITEVMPDSQAGSGWIELYNNGDTTINLNLFYLSDNEADASPCRLPDSTLAPGEYALIRTGDTSEALSVPFSFGSNDHGAYLYDVTGILRGALNWQVIPGSGVSVVGDNAYTKQPSPGAANSGSVFSLSDRTEMNDTDPVRISEVLADNAHSISDVDGERSAWAEVHNQSSLPVSLSGYYLSDDADDPLKWAFPAMTLQPDGYAVVFLSGTEGGTETLQASFSLSADEDALYLTDISTMHTDTLALPASVADVSIGRAADGSPCYYACPSPSAANTQGYALLADALSSRTQGVYISEVCASGEDGDWVELYNGSNMAVDLTGWYLSDDADEPLQWRIPSLTIAAGGYTVIAGNGTTDAAAPFGISITGETIVLSNAGGALVDAFDSGVLRTGLTSGRAAGSATLSRTFFLVPTPGAPNSDQTSTGYAIAPVFSDNGLYHTEAFSLSITPASEDTVIYYTLDGSVPGEGDIRYTGPITIEDNTVVRAVAFSPGLMASDVVTATYLFEEPHTVPVVCLSGEPSQMYTIFNKASRNYKPEYAGNVEYYEADGTLGISFTAGIVPKGRSSLKYDQKSVTIRLQERYGRTEITYPLFEDGGVSTFSEFTLRNSGQDYFGSRLRDSFVQQLAQGMDVDGIRTRLAAVYMNGVYWGLYDLNEEQEEGYFEAYYGLEYDDIDMIDRNNTVKEGSVDNYLLVRSYARNWDLSDDAVFAQFTELVDADACMDYLIVNTFFGNGDVMNQRFWRAQDGSVSWRPLLFDLDWCMRFDSAYRDTFPRYFSREGSAAGNGTITNMDIFYGLKKNAAWREAFIDRFIEVAYTHFDTDRVLALFDETVAQMEPEMTRHIARWHTHRSVNTWLSQTEALRSALEKRRDIALREMADAFGLSNAELETRVNAFLSSR